MREHDAAVALHEAMPRPLAGMVSPHDPQYVAAKLERRPREVHLATLHATEPRKPLAGPTIHLNTATEEQPGPGVSPLGKKESAGPSVVPMPGNRSPSHPDGTA